MSAVISADRAEYVDWARKLADPQWPVDAVDDFTTGWACIPFNHKRHHWQRQGTERLYVALCGVRRDIRGAHRGVHPLIADANDPDNCKHCQRALRGRS